MTAKVPQILIHDITHIARGVQEILGLNVFASRARKFRGKKLKTSTIIRYCNSGQKYIDGPPQWFQRFILSLRYILQNNYRVY